MNEHHSWWRCSDCNDKMAGNGQSKSSRQIECSQVFAQKIYFCLDCRKIRVKPFLIKGHACWEVSFLTISPRYRYKVPKAFRDTLSGHFSHHISLPLFKSAWKLSKRTNGMKLRACTHRYYFLWFLSERLLTFTYLPHNTIAHKSLLLLSFDRSNNIIYHHHERGNRYRRHIVIQFRCVTPCSFNGCATQQQQQQQQQYDQNCRWGSDKCNVVES